MQSVLSPSLTRYDIVIAALRMQLWIFSVMLAQSVLSLLLVHIVFHGRFTSAEWIYGPVREAAPVLVLLMFPQLLAANALGETRRNPVSSWPEIRPLVGRCVGLWLFVYSLGNVVFRVSTMTYDMVTRSGSSLFGSSAMTMWLKLMPWIQDVPVFVLGFSLAFGPAIRDNFRSR